MRMNEPGWLELAGGKLTTYRLMAEQAVDRVARYLRVRAAPCRTALEPLLEAGDQAAFSGILPPPVTRSAVEHYCRNEWARGPEDVMVRRASWQYYLNDAPAVAAQVAAWMEEIAHPTC
jgi:glycerol-3-phosphate dehydrogenase